MSILRQVMALSGWASTACAANDTTEIQFHRLVLVDGIGETFLISVDKIKAILFL